MTSSNSRPNKRGMTPATSRATTRVFRICTNSSRQDKDVHVRILLGYYQIQNEELIYFFFFGACSLKPTMSVHSCTLWTMTVRPWGIQASNTVTPRMDSQQTYSPQAAVYSSWILELPVQKDISQRPVNTKKKKRHVTILRSTG